jgi:hypothetical protein
LTPLAALDDATLHIHSVGLFVPWPALTTALGKRLQQAQCWRRQTWSFGGLFVAHHCEPRRLAQLQAIREDFPAISLSRVDITTDLHFADDHGRWNAICLLRRHLFIRRGATKLVQRIHWEEYGQRNGNWASCDFTEDGPRAHVEKRQTRRTAEGYQDPVDEQGNPIGNHVLRLELSISRQAAKAWPFSEMPLNQVMTLDPTLVLDRLYVLKFVDSDKAPDAFAKPKRRHMRSYRPPTGIHNRGLEFWPYRVMPYTMNQRFALPVTPSWAEFRSEFPAC